MTLLVTLVLACSTSSQTSPEPTPEPAPEPALAVPAVTAAGTRFEPPVQLADVPSGAWMCDMGTVHYASLDKNNGSCPVCGMSLVQKSHGEAAEKPGAGHSAH